MAPPKLNPPPLGVELPPNNEGLFSELGVAAPPNRVGAEDVGALVLCWPKMLPAGLSPVGALPKSEGVDAPLVEAGVPKVNLGGCAMAVGLCNFMLGLRRPSTQV